MMLTIVDHRVQETARALDQKQRLEEKINELNSQKHQQKFQPMKYEAFASQLEAHVGHSPVRGGKAIKTDRKKANNLNQLLSRVKTIFGRKATPATTVTPNAGAPTDLSVVSDPRLRAIFANIEKYLAENFGTATAKLRYEDYTNGASLMSEDATFAVTLVILTATNGAAHLPDNVLLLGGVTSTNDVEWLAAELRKFTNFLMQLCPKHRIQHLAFAFSKDKPDNPAIVKEAEVTCIRLY